MTVRIGETVYVPQSREESPIEPAAPRRRRRPRFPQRTQHFTWLSHLDSALRKSLA
ncbi:hypothetical protein HFP15_20890 [Amycolatopsis sp. K13G38]|uniref:Uncharacterized protein n=1 Tax=Amycolatopsis acididurans TaxID=2724524 RepID=A0ABX1J7R1_9PSEU|nr:hypothetical protein [Amycolatopsis acididurans]NKQ55346.1 hypothetical protein [Amycolatopsis acididurans]